MRRFLVVLSLILLGSSGEAGRLSEDPIWDDGRAEVAVYAGQGSRYGIERSYEVVMIVVKEPHDAERGVKALGDGTPVLKLNIIIRLPTGIYSYHQMLTLLYRRQDMAPLKLAFSSQEWCGTTFKEWRDQGAESVLDTRSYFEAEGDRRFPLAALSDLAFADGLALTLRDDPRPRRLQLVPSQISNRAEPPQLVEAQIEYQPLPESMTVPAGVRLVDQLRVMRNGSVDRLLFDRQPPHHLVRWERADGHVWSLASVERLAYWRLTGPGDAKRLAAD